MKNVYSPESLFEIVPFWAHSRLANKFEFVGWHWHTSTAGDLIQHCTMPQPAVINLINQDSGDPTASCSWIPADWRKKTTFLLDCPRPVISNRDQMNCQAVNQRGSDKQRMGVLWESQFTAVGIDKTLWTSSGYWKWMADDWSSASFINAMNSHISHVLNLPVLVGRVKLCLKNMLK